MVERPEWYQQTSARLSKSRENRRIVAEVQRASVTALEASRSVLDQTSPDPHGNRLRRLQPEPSVSCRLDEAMVRTHLAQAQGHAEKGVKHIAGQKQVIERLERSHLDTGDAERLLDLFLDTQALHLADCDRLERILAEKRKGLVTVEN